MESRGCGWAFSALCVLVKQKEQKKGQILAILKNSSYLCTRKENKNNYVHTEC